MSTEHGESKVPIVAWPNGISAENRRTIEINLSENNLAVAVALTMAEEINSLVKREFEIVFNLDAGNIFDQETIDWSAYLRTAHAVLNAESILKTGKPYEKLGSDFEAIERDNRTSIKDLFLGEDELRELEGQRRAAGQISWFIRELDFADLYKNTSSPLDFVDVVIKQETNRLHEQDRSDMQTVQELHETFKKLPKERVEETGEEIVEFIENITNTKTQDTIDAMEQGKQRFHQLYQDFNH